VTYAQRINAVDLDQPIILSAEGEVMDGQHRLTKAWMQGAATILAVRFPVTPDPDERRLLNP
jgi:ParB-like chromosome segregation protein Spo0J